MENLGFRFHLLLELIDLLNSLSGVGIGLLYWKIEHSIVHRYGHSSLELSHSPLYDLNFKKKKDIHFYIRSY